VVCLHTCITAYDSTVLSKAHQKKKTNINGGRESSWKKKSADKKFHAQLQDFFFKKLTGKNRLSSEAMSHWLHLQHPHTWMVWNRVHLHGHPVASNNSDVQCNTQVKLRNPQPLQEPIWCHNHCGV
jgi:hypothetical protein